MYAARLPRERSRSDYGSTIKNEKEQEEKRSENVDNSQFNGSRFRMGSLSALGARVRSYTSNHHHQSSQTSRPEHQQQRRSQSSIERMPKYIDSEHQEDLKNNNNNRKNIRFFSPFSTSLKKTGSTSKKDRPSSSIGSSSIENAGEGSLHQYDIASIDTSDDDFKLYADWKAGKRNEDSSSVHPGDDSHISSATAYLSNDPPKEKITNVEEEVTTHAASSPGGRSKRFSVAALRRRWSRTDLLDSPSMDVREEEGDKKMRANDGVQPETIETESTFNLRSFRKVRGSSMYSQEISSPLNERTRSRTASMYSTEDDATLPQPSFSAIGESLSNSRRGSGITATGMLSAVSDHPSLNRFSIHSSSKVTSPSASKPTSPRPESRRMSMAGGTMPAGLFLKSAARSRPDLTCAIDDEPGSPLAPLSPLPFSGNGDVRNRTSSIGGTPYRPLTPLGQGTCSPSEELALLEADLARAKNNSSLIYQAQLEEEQAAIKRRQQRQERRNSRQFSSSGLAESPIINSMTTNDSYFPAFGKSVGEYNIRSLADVHESSRSSQSPRPPQTLFERLVQLEKEALQQDE